MKTDQQSPPWDKLRGLFHPGNGVMPPHLAGRDKEQSVMDDFLFALQNKRPADKDIVIYGPRGNGKTVFLARYEEKVAKSLEEDSVLSLRPGDIDSKEKLVLHLIERDSSLWETLKDKLPSKMAIAGKILETTSERLEVEWNKLSQQERVHKAQLLLGDSLIERCRKKPLLVTIDEAQTLNPDVGKYLLNLSEQVRKNGAPFQLILAGTPDLESRINRMDATFWSRARIMGFGRLTRQATTDAIVIPLLDNGFDFVPEASQFVTNDTQQYPYFIQLWGESLCNAIRRNKTGRVIDTKLVESAFEDYDSQRRVYYRTRYSEMVEESLLDAAVDVARAFGGGQALSEQELAGVVDNETKQRLRSLGYIWQDPLSTRYEPGIPSLMDYVLTERQNRREDRHYKPPPKTDETSLPQP